MLQDLGFVMGLAGICLNFLDLSFVVMGLARIFFIFFGFEFRGKIWVLLLWLWLGLGMGKIGANLRLESDISEDWSERGRGTREKRLERDRE